MIALFTDFGPGLYTGMVRLVLGREAPGIPVVDVIDDLPAWDVAASAHLLGAMFPLMPLDSVLLCVVDPGVGSDSREPWMVRVDGRWLVGPGNGLFDRVCALGTVEQAAVIDWRPRTLSATFHGRDLFAPVAARLAIGKDVPAHAVSVPTTGPAQMSSVIYVDHYGNTMTGLDLPPAGDAARLCVGHHRLVHAETFSAVAPGAGFWHQNSFGLIEVAVNRGSAAARYGLAVGDPVAFEGAGESGTDPC